MSSIRLLPLLLAGSLALGCSTATAQDKPPEHDVRSDADRERELKRVQQEMQEYLHRMHEHRREIDSLDRKRATLRDLRASELHSRVARQTDEIETRIADLEHELIDLRTIQVKGDRHPHVQAVIAKIESEKRRLDEARERIDVAVSEQTDVHNAIEREIEQHRVAMKDIDARVAELRKRLRPGERVTLPRPKSFGAPVVEQRVAQLERAVTELREILARHGISGARRDHAMREIERRRRMGSEWPKPRERDPVRNDPARNDPARNDPRTGHEWDDRRLPDETEWDRAARPPTGGALRAEIDELKNALQRARAENDELRQRAEQALAATQEMHTQAAAARDQLSAMQAHINDALARAAAERSEIEEHKGTLSIANEELRRKLSDALERLTNGESGEDPK